MLFCFYCTKGGEGNERDVTAVADGENILCWAELNVDIDPFVIVLDKKGNIIIARIGNNLAEWKDGSLKISYQRARRALEGKKVLGGTKIYWLSGKSPNYKRKFLGAIGISGLGEEREERFVKKMVRFRSHYHWWELPISDLDLKELIQVDQNTLDELTKGGEHAIFKENTN